MAPRRRRWNRQTLAVRTHLASEVWRHQADTVQRLLRSFHPAAPHRFERLSSRLGQPQRRIHIISKGGQRCLPVSLRTGRVMRAVGLEAGLLQGGDCRTLGLGAEQPTCFGLG